MKSKTLVVEVSINEREALSIINALQRGLSPLGDQDQEEEAMRLLKILRGNFQSSVAGINYSDNP